MLKKTVAVMHSPLIYNDPVTFFDHLHKLVYESSINRFFLSKLKKIQVLNKQDEVFLVNTFKLKNVVNIPNSIEISDIEWAPRNDNLLHIVFAGELSLRKGTDVLLQVIAMSPNYFHFYIAGEGPLQTQVMYAAAKHKNVVYMGYLEKENIFKLYRECDVLFVPSRAEGQPYVILEALAHGLKIVNTENITLDLPRDIEYSIKGNSPNKIIATFKEVWRDKKKNSYRKNRKRIQTYFTNNFSDQIIIPQIFSKVFEINI